MSQTSSGAELRTPALSPPPVETSRTESTAHTCRNNKNIARQNKHS